MNDYWVWFQGWSWLRGRPWRLSLRRFICFERHDSNDDISSRHFTHRNDFVRWTSSLLFIFTFKGPKLESESLYLYSCVVSPQLWLKLLCQPRASTQGVKIDWRVHQKQFLFQSSMVYLIFCIVLLFYTILTSLYETNVHCYLSMEYLRNWWHLCYQFL